MAIKAHLIYINIIVHSSNIFYIGTYKKLKNSKLDQRIHSWNKCFKEDNHYCNIAKHVWIIDKYMTY